MATFEQGLGRTVQELAENGFDEPPKIFIRREDERPINSYPSTESPVPVIDFQLLCSSSADSKKIEMDKLRSALQSWGCFQTVGHGISCSFLDALEEVSREFFKLPLEEKMKCSPYQGESIEGYGNDKIGANEQIFDWSDRLYLLVLPEDDRKLKFWPENPPTFRKILHEYTMKVKVIIDQILVAMADLLGLEENYLFHHFGERATLYGRFNYYPPCPWSDLVLGIKPHSDSSGLTLILQEKEIKGLQVLKDDKWTEVPAIPHALLVILGDEMEIMSNGIFKSPVHRVVTNPDRERMSLAMFYSVDDEIEIKPAESLIGGEKPRLYNKVMAKDYTAMFYENYLQGKRAIGCVKVSENHV